MASVYFSKVLNVPASQAWAFVRDFGGAAHWSPSLRHSELKGVTSSVVGAIRIVTTTEGAVLEEQLVEMSDAERQIVYDLIKGDVPFRDYRATLAIREIVADPARCFAEWSGRFDVADDPAPLIEFIRDSFYKACLEELERVCHSAC
jgi:hypothetical protein